MTEKQKDATAISVKKNTPIILLSTLALIIALTAGTESVINYYRLQETKAALNSKALIYNNSISKMQTLVNQLNSQLATTQSQLAQQSQALSQLINNSQANQLQADLNQVLHLYRLADFSLQYQRNTSAALSLLQSAKQIMLAQTNSQLLPLTQAIANDIVALQSTSTINIADLVLQLSALGQQVNELTFTPIVFQPAAETKQNANNKTETSWLHRFKEALKAGWQQLTRFIIIQNHNAPVEPLLTAQQQFLVQENIQLLLTEAQWAVLKGDQTVYQTVLQQVSNQLAKYHLADDSQTQAVIAMVTKLQKTTIQTATFNLSNTENLITTLLQKVNTITAPATSINTSPATSAASPSAPKNSIKTPATPTPAPTSNGEVSI